jgi:hypothetical protein
MLELNNVEVIYSDEILAGRARPGGSTVGTPPQ